MWVWEAYWWYWIPFSNSAYCTLLKWIRIYFAKDQVQKASPSRIYSIFDLCLLSNAVIRNLRIQFTLVLTSAKLWSKICDSQGCLSELNNPETIKTKKIKQSIKRPPQRIPEKNPIIRREKSCLNHTLQKFKLNKIVNFKTR